MKSGPIFLLQAFFIYSGAFHIGHPRVGNWTEAVYFSDLIKIPLVNENNRTWTANLELGTPR